MQDVPLPTIIITTSRNPTQTTRTFCNDLADTIPNITRINRGKSNLDTIAERALQHQAQKIIITDRWKGNLGKIQLYTMGGTGLTPCYPIIYVKNVKLRRDFGHQKAKTTKNLTIQTDTNNLEAQKLADTLSHFLSIPPQLPKLLHPTSRQTTIHISLNTANRIQITFLQTPQKVEIGPRITVAHLAWKSTK